MKKRQFYYYMTDHGQLNGKAKVPGKIPVAVVEDYLQPRMLMRNIMPDIFSKVRRTI